MKVFISWSGDLSKKFAEVLNKWLPCLLHSVNVFYSPEDVEKGENWDQKISAELSDSNFGIICLTPDNISAPWINFEAGAIAKALTSKVTAIMINVNPSDIKGPLSRYQATKCEKDDFFHLIKDINSNSESPINEEVLKTTFNGLWGSIEQEFKEIISKSNKNNKNKPKQTQDSANSGALEEILQLVRKQNTMLSTPEMLFPKPFLDQMLRKLSDEKSDNFELINQVLSYFEFVIDRAYKGDPQWARFLVDEIHVQDFLDEIQRHIMPENRGAKIRIRRLSIRIADMANLYRANNENMDEFSYL